MGIPKELTPSDIRDAVSVLGRQITVPPYGRPRDYLMHFNNQVYAPKAVVGIASARLLGRRLTPEEFSGGEGSGQANSVLRRLGFSVRPIDRHEPETESPGRPEPGSDWRRGEVELTVNAYFDLLLAETRGGRPVKSTIVGALVGELPARTAGAVEYKFSNISAVLEERGLPWVAGYKPQVHYQRELADAVDDWLAEHREENTELRDLVHSPASHQEIPVAEPGLEVEPPHPTERRAGHRGRGVVTGWRGAVTDELNRELGTRGEEWVVKLERSRLRKAGREDLATQVEWVSKERGDGLGYDVASFEPDGSPTFIEVKTTNLGVRQPFIVSVGEVEFSKRNPGKFRLYRVFEFNADPHYYVLAGAVDEVASLEPVQFRGLPK